MTEITASKNKDTIPGDKADTIMDREPEVKADDISKADTEKGEAVVDGTEKSVADAATEGSNDAKSGDGKDTDKDAKSAGNDDAGSSDAKSGDRKDTDKDAKSTDNSDAKSGDDKGDNKTEKDSDNKSGKNSDNKQGNKNDRKPGKGVKAEPLIKFEGVGKIYRTGQIVYEALHDVNLEVMEGELVVILGPSGAGKSTLLNLLGGLDGATSGRILFGGEDITAFDDKRLGQFRAVDVGIVFQFYNLVPTLTAYENVDLMQDLGLKIMDPIKALEMVGLADRKDNFPSQLSGGQQQRISIARAIAKMPRLLLCDEPTGALDTNTGKEVLKILQDQSRVHHKTVVMVTHNALFADIADKVVMVKNGTVVEVITNEDPKDAEELNW